MSSDRAPSLFAAWTRTSSRMVRGMVDANRAAARAFRLPAVAEPEREPDVAPEIETDGAAKPVPVEDRITPGADLTEWSSTVDVADPDELAVGDRVSFVKTVSEADVERFAAASGDTNPLHLDADAASESRFGGRIAHGGLVAGLVSAALARLPGEVIYLSQDLEFLRPVRIGDRLTADVEVVEALGDGRLRLSTRVLDPDGEPAVDGEAIVLVD